MTAPWEWIPIPISNTGGTTIDINALLGITAPQIWALRQFQVYNLNSAMCDDGSVGVDSDSDLKYRWHNDRHQCAAGNHGAADLGSPPISSLQSKLGHV